ncbi:MULTISPECIES: SGNH/GDSL hydrolase family protein [unclassified Microbacterium]|uniref:SGNH/GDSL hydrolase family protein n=1 Tax=unclassified Microbacterium TaxID=2609290 RepID=UPI001E00826E|nr:MULTISPECIES: SGNH/GDSL hydrolase family protein [unclassified Microbacterium]CAH0123348.1 Acetylxylan esterase [Microbacterium sp. Bi121]HWK76770.1 SGNH/GDSL hydrolase family protein [Microbacterium sp.]
MNDASRLHDLLASGRPATWVMTGDSITHGLLHTRGARNYVDHLHELIRGDLGRVQDAVINTAISGWRIPLILDDFDRRVATWHPDVVTLMIGTNDCSTVWVDPVVSPAEFAADLTVFVSRVRGLGAIPVLQTPPFADLAHAPDRARLAEFAEAMREVAVAEEVLLVDQHAVFAEFSTGTGPGNEGMPWGLLDDAFHPNAAGHALMALELARTLGLVADGSRVVADLTARVEVARHPQWPPA